MRIGIVSPSYGYGGANIVSANLGKELLAHHDVYFFPNTNSQTIFRNS